MPRAGFFTGTTAVVTGAGSGIGRELTLQLLAQQGRVLAVDIDQARLQQLKSEAGSTELCCFAADLSCQDAIDGLFEQIERAKEGCDFFFANAGFARHGIDLDLHWDDLEDLFRLNVFSPLYCLTRLEQQVRLESSTFRRRPTFVVTASAMSRIPMPGYGVYGATKAAVDNFYAAVDWETDRRVRLAIAYPITTRTDFFRAASIERMPWPSHTAKSVANSMLRGLRRGRRHLYPSLTVRVMLALSRLCPPIATLLQYVEQRQRQPKSQNAVL